MGFKLRHPLVPSASPMTATIDRVRRLEDAGASAIVLPSLFEEQIEAESHQLHHYLDYGVDSFAEALSYLPPKANYLVGPDNYLNLIRRSKESTKIPIIASLNGVSPGGWTTYANLIEEAGADALELNIYYVATDPAAHSNEIEQMYLDIVHQVKRQVSVPVAVKLGPYFSAFGNMAMRLFQAGADALVLFNRFYQPDFDLDHLEVTPHLVLSDSNELRLPLRWIAILYGRVPVDLALTSGVHTHFDMLKGLMAGAKVTMIASELLHNGPQQIGHILHELARWMEEHDYESVQQMQGSMSQINVADPAAFERANYMKVLQSWRQDPTGMWVH
jgi:dihydroorotate dehydrogenase (fumarate)